MNLIFMGPPGAGKGTQAVIMAKMLGIPHISTGAIFRENIENGTELGKTAQSFMDAGNLVPDEFVLGMVEARLKQPDVQNGFILDGFPRNLSQAALMDTFASIDKVLNFSIDDEEVVRRNSGRRVCECGASYNINVDSLKPKHNETCDICGKKLIQRSDDKESVIRNRLKVYHETLDPVVEHYRERGLVTDIDGSGSVDEVTELTIKALE